MIHTLVSLSSASNGQLPRECIWEFGAIVVVQLTLALIIVSSPQVQTGQNWAQATTDERTVQLMRLLNKLLATHPQSRSRVLAYHTPTILPVWPQVCETRMNAA